MHTHTHIHMRIRWVWLSHTGTRGQTRMSYSLSFHLILLRQVYSPNLVLDWWPASPSHLPVSAPHSARGYRHISHTQLLIWLLEVWTQVLTLTQQVLLTSWAMSPASTHTFNFHFFYTVYIHIPVSPLQRAKHIGKIPSLFAISMHHYLAKLRLALTISNHLLYHRRQGA